jgi:hypothetical protein
MNHRKAIKILKKMKSSQKKLDLLISYKRNYWKQIAIDRSVLWKIWNYFYIFYVSRESLFVGAMMAIFALLIMRRKLLFFLRTKSEFS